MTSVCPTTGWGLPRQQAVALDPGRVERIVQAEDLAARDASRAHALEQCGPWAVVDLATKLGNQCCTILDTLNVGAEALIGQQVRTSLQKRSNCMLFPTAIIKGPSCASNTP